ncbi:hypothetical protein [Celeribacter naphthalenivorans]|uniref:hypothetical protein n=1 Tax=Celeribacter naphthalenivorans TaxID=1614694 RepID=UPI001CF9F0FB|nr:hypothetical protein [Celeribacter naphthalenivorans]
MKPLILFAVIFCTALSCVTPLRAGPQDDVERISEHLLQAGIGQMVQASVAQSYADHMTVALRPYRVRIADPDLFAEPLPDEVTAENVTYFRQTLEEELLRKASAQQLSDLLRLLQQPPEMSPQEQPSSIEDIKDRLDEMIENKQIESDVIPPIILMGAITKAILRLPTPEVDPIPLFMSDMLEVDGVFEFPNRIVKQDLRRKIEAAHR